MPLLSSLGFAILLRYHPGCHVLSDVFSLDLQVFEGLAASFFFLLSVLLPQMTWSRDLQLFEIECFAVLPYFFSSAATPEPRLLLGESALVLKGKGMWFGAFPGAIGLGRAQPQRRGTSP